MRRNTYYETQAGSQYNKNVGDLIYRYETRNGAHLQDILSSPHLQRELEMYYGHPRPDIRAELMRLKLQQHNESLTSLTDSEFFSDDQSSPITKEKVANNLTRLGRFLELLSHLPLPLSFTGMGLCFLFAVFICPRACCENILFPAFRLAFGTLYPAYASYKAVRTKNVKEYVKWMMYWIVYAFFTCIETFTDIFLSWFPFYYEFKVIIVLWLLSPATKGSSTLYRKFVHPMLTRREQEIDEYLNQAKERGYTAVLQLGSKGVNYATNVIMQTALKGGGNLVQTIRRSYSLSDLSEPDVHRTQDEIDEVARPQRLLRPRSQTVRSSSGGRQTSMYFSEVDVEPKIPPANYNYIRSSEDISSGYSSAEPISGGLSRTSSMTNATRPRFKAKRAEDENYTDTDEYDVTRIRTPLYSPEFMNPLNSLQSPHTNRVPHQFFGTLENWKDEVFLDNEQCFQKKEIPHGTKSDEGENFGSSGGFDTKNMTPEMLEKYLMFCKWLEDSEKIKNSQAELSENLPKTDIFEEGKGVEGREVSDIFEDAKDIKKQLSEEDFKDTISTGSGDDEFVDVIPETKVDTISNIQKDTGSMSINNESFSVTNNPQTGCNPQKSNAFANVVVLDFVSQSETANEVNKVQDKIEVTQSSETTLEAPKSAPILEEVLSEKNADKKDKSTDAGSQSSINLPKLESLLEGLQKQAESTLSEIRPPSSCSNSNVSFELENPKTNSTKDKPHEPISDFVKRPVSHGKGKAPEPPETSLRSSISEQGSLAPLNRSELGMASPSLLPSCDLTPSLKPSDPKYTTNITRSHSRSPSPKPEGKKSKKGLFKNYLPSLFRSESPKPTQQILDDYHKETQI